MKKYLMLWLALVAALCLLWAISIADIGMSVLMAIVSLYCIFAQFVLLKE